MRIIASLSPNISANKCTLQKSLFMKASTSMKMQIGWQQQLKHL